MQTKSIAVAAAIAALLTAAGAGEASAHKGRNFHFYSGYHTPYVYVYSGGGCGYYYERWHESGRFYWKQKYYECKGWW
jgi:hypothetical protein